MTHITTTHVVVIIRYIWIHTYIRIVAITITIAIAAAVDISVVTANITRSDAKRLDIIITLLLLRIHGSTNASIQCTSISHVGNVAIVISVIIFLLLL